MFQRFKDLPSTETFFSSTEEQCRIYALFHIISYHQHDQSPTIYIEIPQLKSDIICEVFPASSSQKYFLPVFYTQNTVSISLYDNDPFLPHIFVNIYDHFLYSF